MPPLLSETVATRIRVRLAERRLTGSALARHLGQTQSRITRWTRGEVPVPLDYLEDIADFLGLTFAELTAPVGRTPDNTGTTRVSPAPDGDAGSRQGLGAPGANRRAS